MNIIIERVFLDQCCNCNSQHKPHYGVVCTNRSHIDIYFHILLDMIVDCPIVHQQSMMMMMMMMMMVVCVCVCACKMLRPCSLIDIRVRVLFIDGGLQQQQAERKQRGTQGRVG